MNNLIKGSEEQSNCAPADGAEALPKPLRQHSAKDVPSSTSIAGSGFAKVNRFSPFRGWFFRSFENSTKILLWTEGFCENCSIHGQHFSICLTADLDDLNTTLAMRQAQIEERGQPPTFRLAQPFTGAPLLCDSCMFQWRRGYVLVDVNTGRVVKLEEAKPNA